VYRKLISLIDSKKQTSDLSDNLTEEHHHITGRQGLRLINPFNILCCTREEHDYEQAHHTWERQRELLAVVKPIRIAQGFRPEDYPEL